MSEADLLREPLAEGGTLLAPDLRQRVPAGDRPAIPLGPDGLDRYTRRDLRKEEIAIAQTFHGGRMWPYAVAAFGCFAVWLSFFPLALLDMLNLPLAFALSTIFAVGGYVTGHEAMHSNIARKGEKLFWLNEAVGHISTIPIVCPYGIAKLTHLEHHRHCNHPELDPDYTDEAPNWWMAIWKTWYNRQPGVDGSIQRYLRTLKRLGTPEAEGAIRSTIRAQLIYMAVLFGMAWSGHALVALLVWWLPRQIGATYIQFYLSWAPHHPGAQMGRYKDTRSFRSKVGVIGSMGMEYHIIHHLYPRIPLMRTPAAYWALKPVLEARGCDVKGL